ncbi:hypothetical protein B9Z65_6478 [Elsinoe australis]|uniref:Uncharacterized protein n=1 Tax=Elsinoe australis TaxID=40998 RepID=A0A2P8A8R8_9PEZI|nr:hypothetical protein B9Z65_6478 [Elsinoe australis]
MPPIWTLTKQCWLLFYETIEYVYDNLDIEVSFRFLDDGLPDLGDGFWAGLDSQCNLRRATRLTIMLDVHLRITAYFRELIWAMDGGRFLARLQIVLVWPSACIVDSNEPQDRNIDCRDQMPNIDDPQSRNDMVTAQHLPESPETGTRGLEATLIHLAGAGRC